MAETQQISQIPCSNQRKLELVLTALDNVEQCNYIIFKYTLKGVGAMVRIGIHLTDQEKEALAETARQDD